MVSGMQVALTIILVIMVIIISPIIMGFAFNITDPLTQIVAIFIPVIMIIAIIVKTGSREQRMSPLMD